ncbi:MAG: hypothetical protein FWH27_00965, partial [Planctomycetaceae bacterium]|nr:hypothetical protein [Planctomycetaceae bacterium]
LLALKAFSTWGVFDDMTPYLAGVERVSRGDRMSIPPGLTFQHAIAATIIGIRKAVPKGHRNVIAPQGRNSIARGKGASPQPLVTVPQ